MIIIYLIIILIILQIFNNLNLIEKYSSLDIIYPNRFKKPNPDSCGDCGVLCQYCNIGYNRPNVCNKKNKKNNKFNYNCIKDKEFKKILNSKFVYIKSNLFNKYLNFDSNGNKSYLFINNNKSPQKWTIEYNNYLNTNACLVNIYTYDKNGLKYYLTSHENGEVNVSLIKDDEKQIWEIYKNTINPDKPNDKVKYLIKSYKYCIYLSSNNSGYLNSNSGTLYLSNINIKNIDENSLWDITL